MPILWIEVSCPKHGFERFKVKIIRKYNVAKRLIVPTFRTRPKYELSGIVIGRSVEYDDVKEYLIKYFRETGMIERILSIRMQY